MKLPEPPFYETLPLGKGRVLLPLLNDPLVSDVLINGMESAFVEKQGVLGPVPHPFQKKEELDDCLERILMATSKRVDAASPFLDGALPGGLRFHVVFPPVARKGPYLSFRKAQKNLSLSLSDFGPPEAMEFLADRFRKGANVVISGGTGSGKTTLLSLLLTSLDAQERILVLEETHEIQSDHPHLLFLEGRSASPEGRGEIGLRHLLRTSLRMRPNRIVVGECRGAEVFDMLQAMNSGHPGSVCTVHSNGAREALSRLELLGVMGSTALSPTLIREWVSKSVDLVVHLERTSRGFRQVVEVAEVQGLEGQVYRLAKRYKLDCEIKRLEA